MIPTSICLGDTLEKLAEHLLLNHVVCLSVQGASWNEGWLANIRCRPNSLKWTSGKASDDIEEAVCSALRIDCGDLLADGFVDLMEMTVGDFYQCIFKLGAPAVSIRPPVPGDYCWHVNVRFLSNSWRYCGQGYPTLTAAAQAVLQSQTIQPFPNRIVETMRLAPVPEFEDLL